MVDKEMKADIQKHTLNLRSGDWDYIESMYKPNGISTSVVVRTMISNFVDKKRDQESRLSTTSIHDMSVDLD